MSDEASNETSQALVVPDIRNAPLPAGWAEDVATPAIMAIEDPNDLDETEAQLMALSSYVESLGRDRTELTLAQRVVDRRRGQFIMSGHIQVLPRDASHRDASHSGSTTSNETTRNGVSAPSELVAEPVSWSLGAELRRIAESWDELWPRLRRATTPYEASRKHAMTLLRTREAGVRRPAMADPVAGPVTASAPAPVTAAEAALEEIAAAESTPVALNAPTAPLPAPTRSRVEELMEMIEVQDATIRERDTTIASLMRTDKDTVIRELTEANRILNSRLRAEQTRATEAERGVRYWRARAQDGGEPSRQVQYSGS